MGSRRLAALWGSAQHVFVVTANDCEDELDRVLVRHPRVLARDGYRSGLVNFGSGSAVPPTRLASAR